MQRSHLNIAVGQTKHFILGIVQFEAVIITLNVIQYPTISGSFNNDELTRSPNFVPVLKIVCSILRSGMLVVCVVCGCVDALKVYYSQNCSQFTGVHHEYCNSSALRARPL